MPRRRSPRYGDPLSALPSERAEALLAAANPRPPLPEELAAVKGRRRYEPPFFGRDHRGGSALRKAPRGLGMYVRRTSSAVHGPPDAMAGVAAEAGLSFVVFLAAWQDARADREFYLSGARLRDVAERAAALRRAGVKVGLWFYPWGGGSKVRRLLRALREASSELGPDFLVADPELGAKWRQKDGTRKQRVRSARAPFRGPGPAVRAAAEIVEGCDAILREHRSEWGFWVTSYPIPGWHPTLPWHVYLTGTHVRSPQLYRGDALRVQLSLAAWKRAARSGQERAGARMLPSVPTFGPRGGEKLHDWLSTFVDAGGGVDGFTLWSWRQTDPVEWRTAARWSAWLEGGLCSPKTWYRNRKRKA